MSEQKPQKLPNYSETLSFTVNGRKMWPFFFVTSISNVKEPRKTIGREEGCALPVAFSTYQIN